MNNSILRHCRHDRSSACFARFLIALGLVATTVCGCHYCPYNRHVLKPGQSCASDHISNPYACHPGGRRSGIGCVDAQSNRHHGGCTDEQLEAYYPTPEPADGHEEPAAPADVTEETPSDVAIDEPQEETSPLQSFAPLENFPPPPNVTSDSPAAEEQYSASPFSGGAETAVPLFEGRIELDQIEVEPREQTAIPDATLDTVESPSTATPTQTEAPALEEVEESPVNSLFRLRLPPRLFRLRDDEVDVELTDPADAVPPISEASATQGSRILYGHSLTAPTQLPSAQKTDTSWYGHSLQ